MPAKMPKPMSSKSICRLMLATVLVAAALPAFAQEAAPGQEPSFTCRIFPLACPHPVPPMPAPVAEEAPPPAPAPQAKAHKKHRKVVAQKKTAE